MRYPMNVARDPVSAFAFTLVNINESNSYVELTESELIVSEGSAFDETFALSELGRASMSSWEWYMGLGVRADFQGTVAPITSLEKVVSIPLIEERSLFIPLLGPLGLKVSCKRLVFSLVDPDSFLVTFNANKPDPERPTSISID